jgi:hypothetical protein
MALAPSRDALIEAITWIDGKCQSAGNKELQELIRKVDQRQSIWMTALVSKELKKELSKHSEANKLFRNVQYVSGGLTVDDGLRMDFVIQTQDAKTANDLRPFLDGIKAILSLAAMNNKSQGPLLTKLVAAIKVASVANTVTIKAVVSKEDIEKGMKQKPQP